MIGMILLVITNVSASDLTLKLEPSKLNLTGEPNTEICQNLKIEYSVYDGSVEGRDLWAEKGVTDKNLSLHTLDAEDLGLVVTYPESVNILGSEDVDVCVTGPEGLYHGALLYRTIQDGGVGIELNVWITVDIKEYIKEEDNNSSQDNDESSGSTGGSGSSSGRSGGRSSSSSGSENFGSITLGDTIAKITGGIINLGGSKSDENNKGSGFLIIIPIVLLILIALIVILSVKKSKKKVLSK